MQNFYHGISPALRHLPLVPHQLDHPVELPGNGVVIVQLELLMLLLFFLIFSVLVANPKKLLYTVANPVRGLLSREKIKENKTFGRAPPPSPLPCCLFGEKKIEMTQRISMPRRCTGLGPSHVRTRVPSTRRLGQWVSLRKLLRFRV